jgi:uncharacterized protein (DUF1800 family)
MATPAADVAHLLRRAWFGGTAQQVSDLAALDLPAVVDKVLDTSAAPAETPPAFLTDAGLENWQKLQALVHWWYDKMATSPAPIIEKMTFFWHGHFTTAIDKVDQPDWIYQQNAFYRANVMSDFSTLSHGMALQPAMLVYLDNDPNVKGAPNQNFARELMELFTIGIGNYTQGDVEASSRAWTGHNVDEKTRKYVFNASQHDTGMKTFFGKTANWDGPQIIDEILTNPDKRPVVARYMAKKLWEFFAYQNPDPALVQALADVFTGANLGVGALLRAIFLRPEFYSATARQGRVRSPVEFMVNMMRLLGLTADQAHPDWFQEGMGQELMNPPNVSGWRLNGYWLSTSAASAKADMANHLNGVLNDLKKHPLADTSKRTPADAVAHALDVFAIPDASVATKNVLTKWMTTQRAAKQSGVEANNLLILTVLAPELQLA